MVPPDTYNIDGFNMREWQNCHINFDENILISCEGGLTLIDRLSNFLFPDERSNMKSNIIVDNLRRGNNQSIINNQMFTSYYQEGKGFSSYRYDNLTEQFSIV
jgi:hypothetical protein